MTLAACAFDGPTSPVPTGPPGPTSPTTVTVKPPDTTDTTTTTTTTTTTSTCVYNCPQDGPVTLHLAVGAIGPVYLTNAVTQLLRIDPDHAGVMLTAWVENAYLSDCTFSWDYGDGSAFDLHRNSPTTAHAYAIAGSWIIRGQAACRTNRVSPIVSVSLQLPVACVVGNAPGCLP